MLQHVPSLHDGLVHISLFLVVFIIMITAMSETSEASLPVEIPYSMIVRRVPQSGSCSISCSEEPGCWVMNAGSAGGTGMSEGWVPNGVEGSVDNSRAVGALSETSMYQGRSQSHVRNFFVLMTPPTSTPLALVYLEATFTSDISMPIWQYLRRLGCWLVIGSIRLALLAHRGNAHAHIQRDRYESKSAQSAATGGSCGRPYLSRVTGGKRCSALSAA